MNRFVPTWSSPRPAFAECVAALPGRAAWSFAAAGPMQPLPDPTIDQVHG